MNRDFSHRSKKLTDWSPPDHWLKISTIDAHTGGEPLRVVIGGYPELKGDTILERRAFAQKHLDYLRTVLMWEPRGHADMYGCILTPPVTPGADLGVLFLHNEGYSTMCGHGIIALTNVVLEAGLVAITEPETILKIDTPAGLVTSHARIKKGKIKSVYFHNVPAYVVGLDEEIRIAGSGPAAAGYDLAFGGAFYAYVNAHQVDLTCSPEHFQEIIEKGMAIKKAIMANRKIEHPFERDLNFLYGTIFIDEPSTPGANSRHVCVFAEGEVDRSPTGTGVSGRLAINFARGEIQVGESLVIESLIGSQFTGRVVKAIRYGPYTAIIPEVEGTAHITGKHEFYVDPDDPLGRGFILR